LDVKEPVLLPRFVPHRITRINDANPIISARKDVRDRMAIRSFKLEHPYDEPIGQTVDGSF
jgi:hypothetical protein